MRGTWSLTRGFHGALRRAGPMTTIAATAGVAGMVLVTVSHATPIALAQHLAPAYLSADGAAKESLAATQDTFASFCLLMNYFGDALVWGVTTPLFALAALRTKAVPRPIPWIGLVSAVFAGWLGLFGPLSSAIDLLHLRRGDGCRAAARFAWRARRGRGRDRGLTR